MQLFLKTNVEVINEDHDTGNKQLGLSAVLRDHLLLLCMPMHIVWKSSRPQLYTLYPTFNVILSGYS